MGKRSLLGIGALLFAALVSQTKAAGTQQQQAAASPAATYRAVLDQYCVTCHSDRIKRANFSLEKLDLNTLSDHPEIWEKVIRKLRAGVMPPPGIRRPPVKDYEGLRDWLENELDRTSKPFIPLTPTFVGRWRKCASGRASAPQSRFARTCSSA